MPPRTESALRTILIGIAGGLLMLIGQAALSTKENTTDHTNDIAAIRADVAETRALMQRMLDSWCSEKPQMRTCK